MLDGSFILATSAIRLITMVSDCLLGLTLAKVMLNSLIHHLQMNLLNCKIVVLQVQLVTIHQATHSS